MAFVPKYGTIIVPPQNGKAASQPASPSPSPMQAPKESYSVGGFLGNVVGSGINMLGGIGNAVLHPINTIKNVANIGIGAAETGIEKLSGRDVFKGETEAQKTFSNVADFYKERYGGLDKAAKTAYKDPIGFLSDLSMVAGGIGAGMKAAGLAETAGRVGQFARAVDPLSQAAKAGRMVRNIGSKAGDLAREGVGITTGAGETALTQAFKNGTSKEFQMGISGATKPREIITKFDNALDNLENVQKSEYQTILKSLKGAKNPIDANPIVEELAKQISDNIGIPDKIGAKYVDIYGNLDFSSSRIAVGSKEARLIQDTVNDIRDTFFEKSTKNPTGYKAKDITPLDLDHLKQRMYSRFQDEGIISSFQTSVNKSIVDAIKKAVPEYESSMGKYKYYQDLKNSLRQELKIGGKAAETTIMNRIIEQFRKDNPIRQDLMQNLNKYAREDLISLIAGHTLSPWFTRGAVSKVIGAGGLGFAAATSPAALAGAAFFSPRLVGRALQKAGKAASKASKVMKPATNAASKIGRYGKVIKPAIRETIRGGIITEKAKK